MITNLTSTADLFFAVPNIPFPSLSRRTPVSLPPIHQLAIPICCTANYHFLALLSSTRPQQPPNSSRQPNFSPTGTPSCPRASPSFPAGTPSCRRGISPTRPSNGQLPRRPLPSPQSLRPINSELPKRMATYCNAQLRVEPRIWSPMAPADSELTSAYGHIWHLATPSWLPYMATYGNPQLGVGDRIWQRMAGDNSELTREYGHVWQVATRSWNGGWAASAGRSRSWG